MASVSMMGESPEVLARYEELLASGMAPGLAEILASRIMPSLGTDTEHYKGQKHLSETAGDLYYRKVHKEARDAGIKVSPDTPFNGSFADKRGGGDPRAWQMAGCGRGHFKDTCEQRGELSPDLGVNKVDERRIERNAKKQERINKRKNGQ